MTNQRGAVLLGLFLCSLALRPQLVGAGPLLPRIEHGLGISHAVAGLLGTIPVLCMGLFAPSAAYLLNRVGSRQAIAASVALLAVAGLARALVPGAAALLVLTVPVGIGIALAGTLLPVAVKERFADSPAFGTGIYATGLNLGSALSSALAVPLAVAVAGWRSSFGLFSAVAFLVLPVWLALSRHEPAHRRPAARPPRLPLRSGVAWWLVLVFALMGTCFYGLNAWLPDSYVERGWSQSSAGALLGVFNFASIPGALFVPWLAEHVGSRRHYLVGCSAAFLAGMLGLVLAPGAGWAFAPLAGVGVGTLFPFVMTLPLDVADRPADVGAVAGLMLGAGYCISALSPLALGALRDATGSFSATLWAVLGLSTLLLLACVPLTRERLHRGALRGPAPASAF